MEKDTKKNRRRRRRQRTRRERRSRRKQVPCDKFGRGYTELPAHSEEALVSPQDLSELSMS